MDTRRAKSKREAKDQVEKDSGKREKPGRVEQLEPRIENRQNGGFICLLPQRKKMMNGSVDCDWKADSLYILFNPLTPRVKPWVIQSFLTFDSMYRTLKCDH